MFNRRLQTIPPSATFAIEGKIRELRARGVSVIGLGAGELDFDTPDYIKNAAKEALDKGYTKYTPVAGIPELRCAIQEKLERENNLSYDIDEIVVCHGVKQALFNALTVLLSPKDEVLLPTPYWVSYPAQVLLAGGKPVVCPTKMEKQWELDPAAVRRCLTPKTKVLLLNSPNNPSGMMIGEKTLRALAKLAKAHDLWIISDEIYDRQVFDGQEAISIASLGREVWERTITVNGFSKTYSMTGWRLGYAAGPKPVIDLMAKFQGHSTSCANSIGQFAALAALSSPQEEVERFRAACQQRRDLVVQLCSQIPGLRFAKPQGTFFIFLDVRAFLKKKVKTSQELAAHLVERNGVAVVPGEGFGVPGFLRLSYAAKEETLREGMKRLSNGLTELMR